MIIRENYEEEHIRELQSKSRRDPQLIERALYAMGLLEALTQTGMKFIFKGGSCLMVLLPRLMRLSTDIDIIVDPGTDVKEYIEKAAEIFPFVSYEEQVRVGKNNIKKGTSSLLISRRSGRRIFTSCLMSFMKRIITQYWRRRK